MLAAAKHVFFDFDGPICQLFADHPASQIAERMRKVAAAQGILLEGTSDPHRLLRAAGERFIDRDVLMMLEQLLTEEEVRAAATARPTRDADQVIQSLRAADFRIAVTTNNSAAAATRYLSLRGLERCFGGHVYGRSGDPERLKPDPDCVARALQGTGADASEAVLLGDSPSDLEAARAMGVRFLGYARNERKWRLLQGAGATVVVRSLSVVLEAVRSTR